MRRLPIRMALSARLEEGNLVIIDDFKLPEIKTKEFVNVMNNFEFDNCLVVANDDKDNVKLSARNVVGYKILPVAGVNVYDILKHSKLMVEQATLDQRTERLIVGRRCTI